MSGEAGTTCRASVGAQDGTRPSPELFGQVVGQPEAVAQLAAASRRPVHAYLLVGPAGAGARQLARGFAAALLCPEGGCGICGTCRRALEGIHQDLTEVERSGAALSVEDARRVVQLAQRRPSQAARQVIVVADIASARLAAPVLLKTLEEPPPATVLVLLAESVPAELATIASRCVRIDLVPVPADVIARWLAARGVEPDTAAAVAEAAGGDVERAVTLSGDAGFAARLDRWRSVPGRLDGTGAAAATLADELLASIDEALAPRRQQQADQSRADAEEAEAHGLRIGGRQEREAQQRREERRWRTDELRAGLGALSGAYRDRLADAAHQRRVDSQAPRLDGRIRQLAGAVAAVDAAAAELVRNPNETLLLQALLVRLSAVVA